MSGMLASTTEKGCCGGFCAMMLTAITADRNTARTRYFFMRDIVYRSFSGRLRFLPPRDTSVRQIYRCPARTAVRRYHACGHDLLHSKHCQGHTLELPLPGAARSPLQP